MWRQLVCTILLGICVPGAWAGSADAYPTKPIRIVDGFTPGGGTDLVARLIGPKLTERLGQTVIVENRPGAAGTIASGEVARAAPDGYTLMIGTSVLFASSPSLYRKLGHDPVKDFAFISQVTTSAYVLVAHPSLPARSLKQLVALARSKPKAIHYASAGVGSPIQLTMELLLSRTGMQVLHVPYKGGALATIAVVGGEAQIAFASIASSLPMIQTKRLNALAVAGATRMTATLPDVPTIAESGYPGFNVVVAYAIAAPAATPAAVVKLLNAEIRAIVQMDDIKAKLAAQALDAAGSTPDEIKALIEAEAVQWARLIRERGITVN